MHPVTVGIIIVIVLMLAVVVAVAWVLLHVWAALWQAVHPHRDYDDVSVL